MPAILTFVVGLTSGLLGAASFFWLNSVSVYLDNHQSIDVITARSIRVVDPYSGASLHLEPTALWVSDPSGRPTIALGGGLEGTSLVMMDQAHHERVRLGQTDSDVGAPPAELWMLSLRGNRSSALLSGGGYPRSDSPATLVLQDERKRTTLP